MDDLPAARRPELIKLASGDSATVVPVEHEGVLVLELVAHDGDAGVIATLELTALEAELLAIALGRGVLEIQESGNARGPTENRAHGNPD